MQKFLFRHIGCLEFVRKRLAALYTATCLCVVGILITVATRFSAFLNSSFSSGSTDGDGFDMLTLRYLESLYALAYGLQSFLLHHPPSNNSSSNETTGWKTVGA